MDFEVKLIYIELLGAYWLSPPQESEFNKWFENYYKEEYGLKEVILNES